MVTAPAGGPIVIYRWQRYLRGHPLLTDVLLAFVLVSVSFPGGVLAVDGSQQPARWNFWLVEGIACAAMSWHRRHLRTAALVSIACTVTGIALGFIPSPLVLAPAMAALFLVAVRASQRASYVVTAVTIAAVACAALIADSADSLDLKVTGPAVWLLLPAALGSGVRLRLAYIDAVRTRAEYAERTREEEARHRVAEERLRIARDLHDVAAHHLALANAQAGTIAHLIDADPGRARGLADDLGGTISAALRELKSTVGLLREAGDPEAPLEPSPGLARLPDLAASFRSAGLAVAITTEGEPRPLSPGVDLTAYRIIQEALTNVARHAASAEARVRLAYGDERLRITITNEAGLPPSPAVGDPGPGYGLIGMRERALSVGGRLRASQRPAGGFEVATELPLHPGRDRAA